MPNRTRIAIIDPSAGASGDMLLGALVACGVPGELLTGLPGQLGLADDVSVALATVRRAGITATKVTVTVQGEVELPGEGRHHHDGGHGPHRHVSELLERIAGAPFSEWVRERATAVFRRLAEAEGRVHGQAPESVSLHEVGAWDALIDVVGVVAGFEQLGVAAVYTRALPLGSGWAHGAHGAMAVPAPATSVLLEGLEVTTGGPVEGEAVTPTGAALVQVLSSGPPPAGWRPLRQGWGAGFRDPAGYANALRLYVAELVEEAAEVVIVAADLDDLSPEYVEPLREALVAAGAVDVQVWATQMKKGRPGIRVEALCRAGSGWGSGGGVLPAQHHRRCAPDPGLANHAATRHTHRVARGRHGAGEGARGARRPQLQAGIRRCHRDRSSNTAPCACGGAAGTRPRPGTDPGRAQRGAAMRKTGILVLTGLALLGPRTAAAQQRVARVAKAMGIRYVQPTCDLKYGHFQVSSAATYLKSGTEASDPVKTGALLEKSVETATKAITDYDQGENGAAWYLLGRAYLQLGDIQGADSAFTKATEFAPQCGEDIKSWRQRAWLLLMNPATKFTQEGNADSALVLYRQAATISRAMPQGFYNMGVLFANMGETDSALAYFGKAKEVAAAEPDKFAKDRNAATFNLAAMYQRSGDHQHAIEELEEYVKWAPNDTDAKRALATSLRAVGKSDEAAALDKEVLAAAAESGNMSTSDMMSMGINFFNEKKFEEAADAFRQVLAKQPFSRDARYNLANAYYALGAGDSLVATANQLIAMEPLNEDTRKLLAQGYRLQADTTKLIDTVTELMAMPTSVSVERFAGRDGGAVLGGTAVGRQGENLSPAARTIVVEFLDKDGNVVTSKEVEIPALEAGQKFEWSAEADGDGIVGWRYTVK